MTAGLSSADRLAYIGPMPNDDRPSGIAADDGFTLEELQLAARNHGMPLEALSYDLTPGRDALPADPFRHPGRGRGELDRGDRRPGRAAAPLSIDDLRAPPGRHAAGDDGVRRERTRPPAPAPAQPAVAVRGRRDRRAGPAPRCAPFLEEAGLERDAVEVVFGGADHGTQGGSNRTTSGACRSPTRCATTCSWRTR